MTVGVHLFASVLATGLLASPLFEGSTQPVAGGSKSAPIVTATDAPAGTETLPAKWISVAVPDLGMMRAAVAQPAGTGPFPAVLVLHGTHGFAREYVEWAAALARDGFLAVAACWFASGGGAGVNEVTPIACPDIPPLAPGENPAAVQIVDALVQATRGLPVVRGDQVALVGHSRGAGLTLQYLLAGGNVQAAVLHSSGYALRPWQRAAEFNVPILIMHGTADNFSDNTRFGFAVEFEASLRANKKSVESAYCQGCGHNTFFTSAGQRDTEVRQMTDFLRRSLRR
jgi:dienelactone hydrolase